MITMQIAAAILAVSGAGNNDVVLLDFTAPWCGPCQQVAPVIGQLESGGYPVRKVDFDREKALVAQYNITQVPTFVLVVNGREVDRASGGQMTLADFQQMFQKVPRQPLPADPVVRAQSPDPSMLAAASPPAMPKEIADTFLADVRPNAASASLVSHQPQMASRGPQVSPLMAASVRLRIEDPQGNSYGSGTIIDARGGEALILTCGHVFRDSQGKGQILVDLFEPGAPQKIPGELISYNLERDIGLVTIKTEWPVKPATVGPRGHSLQKGDPVVNVGCSHGADATMQQSSVRSINRYPSLPPNLQVAGQPVQGRSGGGLFTPAGVVVGVCNAADPKDDEGLYAALASIQAELDRHNLTYIYDRQAGMPTNQLLATSQPVAAPPAGVSLVDVPPPVAAPNRVDANATGLSAKELAVLNQLRAQADDSEVICIIRPRNNPEGKSEVIHLDKVSPSFIQQLTAN